MKVENCAGTPAPKYTPVEVTHMSSIHQLMQKHMAKPSVKGLKGTINSHIWKERRTRNIGQLYACLPLTFSRTSLFSFLYLSVVFAHIFSRRGFGTLQVNTIDLESDLET